MKTPQIFFALLALVCYICMIERIYVMLYYPHTENMIIGFVIALTVGGFFTIMSVVELDPE